MGMSAQTFSRDLKIATAGLEPKAIKAKLVSVAKSSLAEALQSGEGSPDFVRIVNGVVGEDEDKVVLPGPIVYQFNWISDVAVYAVAFLKARWKVIGPPKGGHYQTSFFVLADGHEITLADVEKYSEIAIINEQPYARKVQVGSKGFSVPKGLFENCRQSIFRKFGSGLFNVEVKYVTLSGGYVLKGRAGKKKAKQNLQSSAFRAGRGTLAARKDTAAGQPLRYPALVISEKK
jgi:hypothetical protein